MPRILEPTAVIFRSSWRAESSAAKKGGSSSHSGSCYSSSKLPGRAWGHTGHNKGHSESLMWQLCSVNATLDLAPSSIFKGGIQIEAQEWEAGIKKRKIVDCWDVPNAETLRRKETEAFKLYFMDSEELWEELGGRMATDVSTLLSLSVPCTLSTPHLVSTFLLFLGVLWENNVVIFALPDSLVYKRDTARKLFYKTLTNSKIAFLLSSCITRKSISGQHSKTAADRRSVLLHSTCTSHFIPLSGVDGCTYSLYIFTFDWCVSKHLGLNLQRDGGSSREHLAAC